MSADQEIRDPEALHVLQDPPLPGAANMARDEALLKSVGRGAIPPTLRLYEWSEPTISLGYFQGYAEYEVLPPPAGRLPVVRRLTGGGAILHDRELTYSLTVPANHTLVAGNPSRLYELVHEALMVCLAEAGVESRRSGETDDSGPAKGPFFCFARRHRLDVLIGSDKVAGSAQRRTSDAVLQHGSIIFERRFEQQPTAGLLVSGIAVDTVRRHLPATLSKIIGIQCLEDTWAAEVLQQARSLESKYAGQEWTRRR